MGRPHSPVPKISTKSYTVQKELTMWELLKKHDVLEVLGIFSGYYEVEAGVLGYDPHFLERNLTMATTLQEYDKSKEFIAIYREDEIEAACWFDRGGYAAYSTKEISNAKFHHVRLDLPLKKRVRLVNQMIDQHILWAHNWGIPVVCSSSVRVEHDGFMRIHAKRGFTVHGSFAWIETEEGMKWIR